MVIKNKILILLFALFFANTAFAQQFKVGNVTYKITPDNPRTVEVYKADYYETTEIPATVTFSGVNYTVTAIGNRAFKGCDNVDNISNCPNSVTQQSRAIVLPNTIKRIGEKAFICCVDLETINIPEGVTEIGDLAFWGCESLTSIVIPEGVTTIGERTFRYCINLTSVTLPSTLTTIGTGAFKYCESLTTITIPANVTSIGSEAFEDCESLTTIICLGENPPTLGSDVFGGNVPSNVTLTVPCDGVGSYQNNSNWNSLAGSNISSDCNYSSVQNGNFNNPETWGVSAIISGGSFTINQAHTVTIPNNQIVTITDNSSLTNNGVLRIAQGGQLINNTETNLGGIIEVEANVTNNNWSYIGAPFAGYKLESIVPQTNPQGELVDVSISMFDYSNNEGNWSDDWATIETAVGVGEGFAAWAWGEAPVVFTTYGDVWNYETNSVGAYSFPNTPAYQLNNGEVVVSHSDNNTSDNINWLAVANPYTFKLDIAEIRSQNQLQGDVLYKYNGTTFEPKTTGVIDVTEGFFVNKSSLTFNKNQRYIGNSKSSAQRDFVKLAMIDGENEVELLFAHNEEAKQEYDIFDANKLFSPIEVAEPYFVTDGIALVKEEVKQLPYYATMNVRSYETKEITFKATNIPSGIIVRIIDGKEIINLNEEKNYSTTVSAGENAERFKVLFDKARQLTDLTSHNITITNYNRTINIATAEENLTIKVYNALGQEVLTTKDYNFTLSEVPAGAYMIKAFNKTVSETAKIVVK